MTDNASLPTLGTESSVSSPSPTPYPSGARYSRITSAPVLSPEILRGDTAHIVSDITSEEQQKGIGPSAFEGTDSPYLAKVFGMNSTEILQLSLSEPLALVDSYILSLVKERNWVDNADSYNRVLAELKVNLGVDPSLQPLIALERLAKGVKLLRLQNMHRRRDAEIQRAISKINTP